MFHLPESAAETNASILREVEQIVSRGESDQAEFKRSTGQRTEAVRTVCALLNGSGGFVLFGVTDGGVLVGQDVSPETLESIVRQIRRIDPPAREAIANAVCHRDYVFSGGSVGVAIFDDRVEISSTGPLRFGLTVGDLRHPHPSLPWNPTMATVLYLRGLIERWGRGTLKINELMQRAGLLAPEFEERAGEVVVRFFPSSYIPPTRVPHDLTELQREILLSLAEHGPSSSVVVQGRLPGLTSNDRVIRSLQTLRHLGLVEKIGVTRGVQWRLVDKR